MAGRDELLQGIKPGMRLDRAFFLKVYGYEITWPGFAKTAMKALENAGCSRAWDYYISAVSGYEQAYWQQVKEAGAWYLEECERKWKRKEKEGEEQRRQEEIGLLKRKKQLLGRKRQLLTGDWRNCKAVEGSIPQHVTTGHPAR